MPEEQRPDDQSQCPECEGQHSSEFCSARISDSNVSEFSRSSEQGAESETRQKTAVGAAASNFDSRVHLASEAGDKSMSDITPVLPGRIPPSQMEDDDSPTVIVNPQQQEPDRRLNFRDFESFNQSPEHAIGFTLGEKYTLLELIGKGGMSAVYRAKDLKLNKTVAVKILLPHLISNDSTLKRFELEAKAASSLYHPNLIGVLDYGVAFERQPFIVMELLEGQSLSSTIKENGRLEPWRAVAIFTQICDAMAHAHGRSILHRDLKPSNVMISRSSKEDYARVVDFGIAKLLTPADGESLALTQTGEVFGSPHYMSPEQCSGMPVDERSDIYSMGCLMYETLAGTPPLLGENIMDSLRKQMESPPPDFTDIDPDLIVPERLQLIIFKSLAKQPSQRYGSFKELANALRSVQQEGTAVRVLSSLQRKYEFFRLKSNPLKGREKKLLTVAGLLLVFSILMTGALATLATTVFQTTAIPTPGAEELFKPTLPARKPMTEQSRAATTLLMKALDSHRIQYHLNPDDYKIQMDYLSSLRKQGDRFTQEHRYEEAQGIYEELATLTERIDGPISATTRKAIESLAASMAFQGKYVEAAPLFRDLHSRLRRLKTGPGTMQELGTLKRLEGNALYASNQYRKAIPAFRQALVQLRKSDESPTVYAITCIRIAECMRLSKMMESAAEFYQKGITGYQKAEKQGYSLETEDRERIALAMYYRGYCLLESGNEREAEKAHEQAVTALKHTSGTGDSLILPAMQQLSELAWQRGDFWKAVSLRIEAKRMNSTNE